MRLNSVGYRYHRRSEWVLRDVTLTLTPERITEVTGPNGAGKSTLLRLLAGILRPRRGELEGRPARVGYAPERFPVDQPFTVRGYLSHMAQMRRAPTARVGMWAERLRFGELLDEPLRELSKGSAHKVGLAQALLGDPELLVLDEPFAGLDAAVRAELPALLAELRSGGAIVVVSDHQQCLRLLPGIDRLQVAGRTVTRAPSAPERLTDVGTPSGEDPDAEQAIIEVVVPADQASTVLAKLQADGYTAREQQP
ncbi:ATP-binding cassette domain-containing protein [Actinomadura sp. HBU206391]|uniref:ATP-binding cassette domain-containing protein n=1 Tax=Actinomadura sp. HBU206391 TaxID=2731692 RepID=UPI00164EE914|nr:ATP-binding cassette domain-containing protein [Actinomadura sp. HBU206391]MBC6460006.1 ATP-binding cassette domain-containing protein [Actinomadura sp. HBU206391]